MKTKRIYNLKKQTPDHRDLQAKKLLNVHPNVTLPPSIDLRANCPSVYDQGNLGSCTANAGIAARVMLNNLNTELSRLFQYYMERKIEHDINTDGGAQMRDIGKVLLQFGATPEAYCPYVIADFKNAPTQTAVNQAQQFKIKAYHSVADMPGIKQVLALMQQPVLAGIDVYESFESNKVAANGIVPVPKPTEKNLGGHAILIVGYNDAKKWFICRNSWGESWGDKGYFYLPYEFFTKGFASDFWVLQN